MKNNNLDIAEEDREEFFLHERNPAAVGEITLENLVYYFYMRENGSKLMKLWVGGL